MGRAVSSGSDESFSAQLRAATWGDHGSSQQGAYMSALLDGRLSRAEYAELVGQLYFVYDLLERAADGLAGDAVAAPFALADLCRRAALEADLRFYLGASWATEIRPNAATRRYLDRLEEVCFDWPGGFVAHHYTRYLGDLSGGQYMARLLARCFELTDGEGTSFYRFPGKPKGYKDHYRGLLDVAPWDDAERIRIIDEVRTAYRLNAGIATELADNLNLAA